MLSGQGMHLPSAAMPAVTAAHQTSELSSSELSETAFVTGLFKTILLRNPQPSELTFWVERLESGRSRAGLRRAFLHSGERRQVLANLHISLGGSNDAFVDSLYLNLLNRQPDARGEAFWIHLLRRGVSRQLVVQGFLDSPEYKQKHQTPPPPPPPPPVPTATYQVTNLVSSVQGLAPNTDANLQNPWGVSFLPGGPFWVSNQITGNTTVYESSGTPDPLVVTIPPGPKGGNPTGQVANTTSSDFQIGGAQPIFIFASLNGTISGWLGGSTATLAPIPTQPAGSSFTGLELANNGTGNFLYAANDGLGRIDVFNTSYQNAPQFAGKFSDPALSAAGFTPYNIRQLGGKMYVAYENTNGGGAVDVFDLNGILLQHLTQNGPGGPLSHPWGMALAPAGFGMFGGDLLVGNEGDGKINAFDPNSGKFLGQMALVTAANGTATSIGFGLWTLTFGGSGSDGDPNTLFFTAGINGEKGGLIGSIKPA
jgi:uncharacterized protein (TIGR03118 family)